MAGNSPRINAFTRDSRVRRGRAVVALGLTAALALSGCSGEDSSKDANGNGTRTPRRSAKGLTVAGEWPLTGLPAKGEAPGHPVMVVKIDNTGSSSPQIGLGKADLVTEELVEGGSTRLAVFFYQHVPKLVGPVRSMRATDIGIVKPAKAVLVASGGAPPTVRRDQGRRHHRVHRGRHGLRARQQPSRAVQPVHAPQPAWRRRSRPRTRSRATCRSARRRTCRRARRPPGSRRRSPAGTPRTGSTRAGSTPT